MADFGSKPGAAFLCTETFRAEVLNWGILIGARFEWLTLRGDKLPRSRFCFVLCENPRPEG